MSRATVSERIDRLERQKARLAEQEARLKADQRKQRTRRLIEAGALVEKAGLLELDANALYGALLSLADGAADKSQVDQWSAHGGRVFAREARERDAGREPLTVTFPAALPTDVTTRLRALNLRWNKVLRHWEGFAEPVAVAEAVAEHGGTVQRVQASETTTTNAAAE